MIRSNQKVHGVCSGCSAQHADSCASVASSLTMSTAGTEASSEPEGTQGEDEPLATGMLAAKFTPTASKRLRVQLPKFIKLNLTHLMFRGCAGFPPRLCASIFGKRPSARARIYTVRRAPRGATPVPLAARYTTQ